MFQRRTFRLFAKFCLRPGLLTAAMWFVIACPLGTVVFYGSIPNWVPAVLAFGTSVGLFWLFLMLQVLHARRVTGYASLRLIWEFWDLDQSHSKLGGHAQRRAFLESFGALTPLDVEAICRSNDPPLAPRQPTADDQGPNHP